MRHVYELCTTWMGRALSLVPVLVPPLYTCATVNQSPSPLQDSVVIGEENTSLGIRALGKNYSIIHSQTLNVTGSFIYKV